MRLLTVSGSPHIHGKSSVKTIMRDVIIATIPAIFASFYFFGLTALILILVSILACLFFEWIIQKFLIKGAVTINDGSAAITGILLAFNVPSNLPLWMMISGAFVAIVIGKMSFGGLGKNPFNPALVGRVFLLGSFPVEMTSWPIPQMPFGQGTGNLFSDALTGPTTMGLIKEGLDSGKSIEEILVNPTFPGYVNDLIGSQGGSLGEISALALLLGAAYLFFKRVISWQIPVAFLGSAILFSGILWTINPHIYLNPVIHLLAGGMILGVFFMATDMVTSPISKKGHIVFGIGAGLLTIIIRVWGAYPEGVSFAILIMNAFVPLINKICKPLKFGEAKIK